MISSSLPSFVLVGEAGGSRERSEGLAGSRRSGSRKKRRKSVSLLLGGRNYRDNSPHVGCCRGEGEGGRRREGEGRERVREGAEETGERRRNSPESQLGI